MRNKCEEVEETIIVDMGVVRVEVLPVIPVVATLVFQQGALLVEEEEEEGGEDQ